MTPVPLRAELDEANKAYGRALKLLNEAAKERDELRSVLEQCLRRLETLNTGGPREPDPTVVRIRAVLKKTKPRGKA